MTTLLRKKPNSVSLPIAVAIVEFSVAGGQVSSWKDSYHGLASQLGSKVVANCASCHGVHSIPPSSDPKSMINFALQYPDSWLAWLLGSIEFLRRIIHRVAAVIMLVTQTY